MNRICFPFTLAGDTDLHKFTSKPEVIIRKIATVIGNGGFYETVIYYDNLGDITAKDNAHLNWIKEKSLHVMADKKFEILLNNKQRQFYLLEKWGINSVDALDIIEYLNMCKKIAGE